MKLIQYIINLIIYNPVPKNEKRKVLKNFKEYWELQMKFAVDALSKKCTAEDYHANQPGYITPDHEARDHFFSVEGPKTFSQLYTYRTKKCWVIKAQNIYNRCFFFPVCRAKRKLNTIQILFQKTRL